MRDLDLQRKAFNRVAGRRLGRLLERAGFPDKAKPLARRLKKHKPLPDKREPSRPVRGSHQDPRREFCINTELEGDLA